MSVWYEFAHKSVTEIIALKEIDIKCCNDAGYSLIHQLIFAQNTGEISTSQLQLLLDAGVDINLQSSDGHTALHCCTNTESIRLLLERNADPNILDCANQVPLDVIQEAAGVRQFLFHGIRGDILRDRGWTCVHSHASGLRAEILALFQEYGHDLNLKTQSGWTPFQLASFSNSNPSKESVEAIRVLRTLKYPPELDQFQSLKQLYNLVLSSNELEDCLPSILTLLEEPLTEQGSKFLLELILEALWKMQISFYTKQIRENLHSMIEKLCAKNDDTRLIVLILFQISLDERQVRIFSKMSLESFS